MDKENIVASLTNATASESLRVVPDYEGWIRKIILDDLQRNGEIAQAIRKLK